MKKIIPFAVLSILLILIVWPMFTPTILGTADGMAHKFRVVSFVRSLTEGNLRPSWMADEAMGYGSPIFLFNYLLPYYAIGILILFGIGIKTATQIYLALAVVFSGIAMYLLVQSMWGKKAGVVSSIAYAAAPYHLLAVYIYEAWGEATAFIFSPLILYLSLKLINEKNKSEALNPKHETNLNDRNPNVQNVFNQLRIRILKIVSNFDIRISNFLLLILAWFLFFLSHNPSVVMFTPILLGFTWIITKGKFRLLVYPVAALILGILLSAFFWLPALTMNYLIKYPDLITQEMLLRPKFFKSMTNLAGVAFETVKKGNAAYYDFSLGLPILIGGLVTVGFFGFLRFKKKKIKTVYSIWLVGSVAVFFGSLYLANYYSNWVWEIFKPLNFIVYPYRFLFPATFAGSLMLGFIGRSRILVSAIIIVLSLVSAKPYTNPWLDIFPYPDDYFHQPHPTFYAPTTKKIMGTVEFLPAGADIKHLADVENNYLITQKLPDKFSFSKEAKIISQNVAVETQSVTYEAPQQQLLTVATHAFPNWEAKLDGKNHVLRPDLAGRITAVVPAGRHVLTLRFGKTPVERIADTLSLITLGGLVLLVILQSKRYHRS